MPSSLLPLNSLQKYVKEYDIMSPMMYTKSVRLNRFSPILEQQHVLL